MKQKLITFAVPCYNSAAYMRKCIDSLLSAGEDCEIIIVNDGSTKDNTAEIADEYAGAWLHGTNRFLDGKPTIAENGSMVTYEDKRVIAFLITYV